MGKMEILRYLLELGYLLICTITDIKKGYIPGRLSVAAMIMGILFRFCICRQSPSEVVWCCIPGLLLLLFAMATREKVGKGDADMVLVTGLLLGGEACSILFYIALLLAVLWRMAAAWRLSGEYGQTKTPQIVFAPFMGMAYLILILLRVRIMD